MRNGFDKLKNIDRDSRITFATRGGATPKYYCRCGSKLRKRRGRFGYFFGCINWRNCKFNDTLDG